MAMVPLIRSIVVTIPVSAFWANATELMSASIEPARIIFASFIEYLSVFGQSEISRNKRIGSRRVENRSRACRMPHRGTRIRTPRQLRSTRLSGAISPRARLNGVARHDRVLLANHCRRVRRPACDRLFGTIAREMILARVENAQREAGPDRRTEIKRHPGDLVLPLRKVVRHDPTRAHVTEPLERTQKLAAIGNLGPPSAQVHRDVDGHEKRQIACNSDDDDGEDHANRTIELRQQPTKANPDDEEGNGPYRILDGVAQIVFGQHRMP